MHLLDLHELTHSNMDIFRLYSGKTLGLPFFKSNFKMFKNCALLKSCFVDIQYDRTQAPLAVKWLQF